MLRRCCQPRLRRHFALIKLLEPFAPPGEFHRAECRLGCARNDVGHRRIHLEQRLEGRANIGANLLQHQHTVAANSDRKLVSDSRRPLRL